MRKDFRSRVVRREEANDLAVARAAVKVVVTVEDYIFGTLKLAEPDRLSSLQTIVQFIRRSRTRDG